MFTDWVSLFLVQLYAGAGSEEAGATVPVAEPVVVQGDPEKGKMFYGTCVACHGKTGEGGRLFNSPRLATQTTWYLKRQLIKFKEGVRRRPSAGCLWYADGADG